MLSRSRQESQEQGTRFGAQTDVHLLIRVQRCSLNISSNAGFRNEDTVRFNVTLIVVSGQRRPCFGNNVVQEKR